MNVRSIRREVRNPVLGLPGVARLAALPLPARLALRELLAEIAADAACRAEQCWRKSKAPMAAYWRAVSIYAKHIKHAVPA